MRKKLVEYRKKYYERWNLRVLELRRTDVS